MKKPRRPMNGNSSSAAWRQRGHRHRRGQPSRRRADARRPPGLSSTGNWSSFIANRVRCLLLPFDASPTFEKERMAAQLDLTEGGLAEAAVDTLSRRRLRGSQSLSQVLDVDAALGAADGEGDVDDEQPRRRQRAADRGRDVGWLAVHLDDLIADAQRALGVCEAAFGDEEHHVLVVEVEAELLLAQPEPRRQLRARRRNGRTGAGAQPPFLHRRDRRRWRASLRALSSEASARSICPWAGGSGDSRSPGGSMIEMANSRRPRPGHSAVRRSTGRAAEPGRASPQRALAPPALRPAPPSPPAHAATPSRPPRAQAQPQWAQPGVERQQSAEAASTEIALCSRSSRRSFARPAGSPLRRSCRREGVLRSCVVGGDGVHRSESSCCSAAGVATGDDTTPTATPS